MAQLNLDNSISHSIVKLFRKINRAHNRQFSTSDLTAEQVHLLSVLWQKDMMTIGQLQTELSLSSGTIAGALDRMEKKGFIRRTKNKTDKRITFIEASFPRDIRTSVEKLLEEVETNLFNHFNKDEKKQFLYLLKKAAQ